MSERLHIDGTHLDDLTTEQGLERIQRLDALYLTDLDAYYRAVLELDFEPSCEASRIIRDRALAHVKARHAELTGEEAQAEVD